MDKQAAKRRREEDEDGCIISMDRISELPQSILHHILSFLCQREAIQTCVLSKSWRYLGSTRPNFEFRERWFYPGKETFLSVMDKILHRYHDQKLSVQKFILEMSMVYSETISFLEKWIPLVVLNMGVSTFSLKFFWGYQPHFALPTVVYKAEFLKELNLERCKFSQINPLDEVLFNHLQKLTLTWVYIADETFEKMMSNCPLIEYVHLDGCEGLKTIKVNKAHHNLKEFYFNGYLMSKKENDRGIEIDAPAVESKCIVKCPNWFHHHKNFPYLKCLHLEYVLLSTKSFDSFSCNYPYLEELSLQYCYGFKEFQLSSRSIKHLTIWVNRSIKAAIDATNILYFEFRSDFLPSITFTTTSREWKSDIRLSRCSDIYIDASSWFQKLNELLKALGHSEISLNIPILVVPDTTYDCVCKTVVVEKLRLSGYYSYSSFRAFLSCLFRIFHPRYIGEYWDADAQTKTEWERDKQLIQFLCEILLMGTETRHYLWQQDLEKASVEVFDENGKQWHPIEGTGLSKNQFCQRIRFRLKWRELEG